MRAVRFLTLAVLMIVGVAGTAKAQVYNNTPGVYTDVRVGVVPAMLPAGSLPAGINQLGPDLYVGTLTISGSSATGFTATYQGERSDGAKLNASASFNGSWAGVKLGSLPVGSSLESNVIIGIDVANLLSGHVNGVGTVDGKNQRLIAKIGAGGSVDNIKVLKAPGNLR
jgi:hypothetical protein